MVVRCRDKVWCGMISAGWCCAVLYDMTYGVIRYGVMVW